MAQAGDAGPAAEGTPRTAGASFTTTEELDARLEGTIPRPYRSWEPQGPDAGRCRDKAKRALAAFSTATRSAAALFCAGAMRRSHAAASCPDVALIEPPCLVAGSDSCVDIHLSRDLRDKETLRVELRRGEQVLAGGTIMAGEGRVVSICAPAMDSCVAQIAITNSDNELCISTSSLLALPESAAGEFGSLLSRTIAEVHNNSAPRMGCCPSACPNEDADVRPNLLTQVCEDAQWMKEAVWATYFRPLCADFAAVLEDLVAHQRDQLDQGDQEDLEDQVDQIDHSEDLRVQLTTYLIANHMWTSASFLLTTCMRSGVRVTLGPFRLGEDDVTPHCLKRHFFLVGTGVAGPVGGGQIPVDAVKKIGPLRKRSGELNLEETEDGYVFAFR
ncbi:unnamed protein product [Ostreobium quekettii]|uniref:Uncharacterized protein n=1 Tax=Ostreobium quekettii TaxID=121088 RepID=A0A8S1IZD2_9CHLO|nr:unnamed protein product [Ostreobium quekettii]